MLTINSKSLTAELDRAGYRKMGVHLKATFSFKEAESYLVSKTVDVIVINFDYEGVNGVEICKHFKSHHHTKDIPIILTSVQSRPKGLNPNESGFDLFIEQPVPRQFFIEKVKELLEEKTRETNRVVIRGEVHFSLDNKEFNCQYSDLSLSGILLESTFPIMEQSSIELSFNVSGYKKPIKARGIAVRNITKGFKEGIVGVGVKFKEFTSDSRSRLERYLEKNQTDPKISYYL